MMREIDIDPVILYRLTRSTEQLMLYVGPVASMDERIASHFEAFAQTDYERLENAALSSPWQIVLQSWAEVHREALKLPKGPTLPAGYILFLGHAARAYDPCLPPMEQAASRIIREFDAKIRRFQRYPWLIDLPITPEIEAIDRVLDAIRPENRWQVAMSIALYEAGRQHGAR